MWLKKGLTVESSDDPHYNMKFTAVIPAERLASFAADTDRLGIDFYFSIALAGAQPRAMYAGSIPLIPGSI